MLSAWNQCRLRHIRRIAFGASNFLRCLKTGNRSERVFIAIGSNVGDRAGQIRRAIERMRTIATVVSTSFLYQSAPMYVTEQPAFLNAVVEIRTELQPRSLLRSLQSIETDLGRLRNAHRFGPRTIDLDIVLYGTKVVNLPNDELAIPHPRLHEREFVLQPLCDIDDSVVVPTSSNQSAASEAETGMTVRQLLDRRKRGNNDSPAGPDCGMTRVSPLRRSTRVLVKWDGTPKLMGIVNATPDSFSDGGKFQALDQALALAEEYVCHGFDIIDIGGQSTRPGAKFVDAEEELSRVLPIVRAVRRAHPDVIVSVDTFQSEVASVVLEHGVDMINDVSAGRLDENMPAVVRRGRCLWVQMHMRGTPLTMASAAERDYGPAGVVARSASELGRRVDDAVHSAGIPRWDVLVDPGVGFAKDAAQSIAVLRGLAQWRRGVGGPYPCVVGVSRKSALRHLVRRPRRRDARVRPQRPRGEQDAAEGEETEDAEEATEDAEEATEDAEEAAEEAATTMMMTRDFASAGAAIAAMHSGAEVFRVHHPKIADALRVAYALGAAPPPSASASASTSASLAPSGTDVGGCPELW